jgi:dissimilatory sulfite reductase (desulfoviridin) alpha/beta subunit
MKIETRVEDVIQLSVEKELYEYEALEKIIELVDEFAIGFAEWLEKQDWEIYHNNTARELLEIYKKEKGL